MEGSSALGYSGVPYKSCPEVLKILWKVLQVIWHRGIVANQWGHAECIWLPKEVNSTKLKQFRSILLLSMEGKIFSVLSRRMKDFLVKNV